MEKEYNFSSEQIESQIPHLTEKGITEFSIHDESISCNKPRILKILHLMKESAAEVFLSILVDASVIDRELISAASEVFCSLDVPVRCSSKGGRILFDKKFYSSKAKLLNDSGIVFGFMLSFAEQTGDTPKAFMERLDFALQQYPNHIDFPQTQNQENASSAKVTGIFSAADIRYCRDIAFACRCFYSAGRAVPWFLSVLKPLRIYPSKFFADFAEWQRCNNCDYKSGYIPENENHSSIEKMQLLFLEQKYEEKNRPELMDVMKNIVVLNGAMSRLAGENEESELNLSYNPDDLLSPESTDLDYFAENVCMEECHVKIFMQDDSLQWAFC